MEPLEEEGIEGAEFTYLEVHPIFIVPTALLEIVEEVHPSDERQGVFPIGEGIGIGGTGL